MGVVLESGYSKNLLVWCLIVYGFDGGFILLIISSCLFFYEFVIQMIFLFRQWLLFDDILEVKGYWKMVIVYLVVVGQCLC